MFSSVYRRIRETAETTEKEAVIVSFFGGDRYYHECAERLADQCRHFGVDHDICEYTEANNTDWVNICKKKINFWITKLREHQRPIFWIDVDCIILKDPHEALQSNADFGAFLRNFKYLIKFDPHQYARLFAPSFVMLGHTAKGLAFAEALGEMASTSPDNVTDDYVLQETLAAFEGNLRIDVLPPDLVAIGNARSDGAVFQFGESGNVAVNVDRARQHMPAALSVERQVRVLNAAAQDALARGERDDAAVFLRRVRRIAPHDLESLRKLLGLYLRTEQRGKYAYHLERAKKDPILRGVALRFEIERRMREGRWEAVAPALAELRRVGAAKDVAFIESRRMRYELDRRAAETGAPDDARTPLWWWEQPYPGNLGDIINPYVVEKLSGAPPRFTNASPRVLAIGSIVKFARAGDIVWGAGAPSRDTPINPQARFRAVRGPLTRDLARAAGADCPAVYGDPAWLLPRLYTPPVGPKTHRVGLIRHHVHTELPALLGDDVAEIPIIRPGYEGIEAFLDEMLRCEAILSTSLHGVIIAHAYGLPAKWCVFSGAARQLSGDGVKFEDYFMSVGREGVRPLDLSEIERIDGALASRCDDEPAHAPDLDALLAAAPFRIAADGG